MNEDTTRDLSSRSFEERVLAEFAALNSRFDRMESRLGRLETRFDEFEERLTALEE